MGLDQPKEWKWAGIRGSKNFDIQTASELQKATNPALVITGGVSPVEESRPEEDNNKLNGIISFSNSRYNNSFRIRVVGYIKQFFCADSLENPENPNNKMADNYKKRRKSSSFSSTTTTKSSHKKMLTSKIHTAIGTLLGVRNLERMRRTLFSWHFFSSSCELFREFRARHLRINFKESPTAAWIP